jgi:hypothetical protein
LYIGISKLSTNYHMAEGPTADMAEVLMSRHIGVASIGAISL